MYNVIGYNISIRGCEDMYTVHCTGYDALPTTKLVWRDINKVMYNPYHKVMYNPYHLPGRIRRVN